VFTIWVIVVILPVFVVFIWMFMSSVKTQMQNTSIPPMIVFEPTVENHMTALSENKILRSVWNSFSVATFSTALGLPAAYSLARWKNNFVSLGILAYIFSWNNFMYSLILGGNKVRTLAVAVYKYIQYAFIDWGGLNATAVIVVLPVVLLTLLVQKHIAKGLTLGAIKG